MSKYTLFIVDGFFGDICEFGVDSVRFEQMSEEELITVAKIALERGMEIAVRAEEDNGD